MKKYILFIVLLMFSNKFFPQVSGNSANTNTVTALKQRNAKAVEYIVKNEKEITWEKRQNPYIKEEEKSYVNMKLKMVSKPKQKK